MNETALLHRGSGSPDAAWGSLGLWSEGQDDYAQACTALADAVAQAARLQPGDTVLAPACGAGEELARWRHRFRCGPVHGVERDAARVARARQRLAALADTTVQAGDAMAPTPPGLAFDRVLCVDAAYHLSPRERWLRQAAAALRPGGRLAYTELTVTPGTGPRGALQRGVWQAAAALCGVPAADLLPLPAQLARLQALGFDEVQAEPLDAAVLDGFAAFVARQARREGLSMRHPGWRRVAVTARLIGPCRRAGLGYALLSARWPG